MFELPKSERLCARSRIDSLFTPKEKLRVGSLMASFEVDPKLRYPQVLFAVPKKKFRKAVDRNRIKRLMREAYRHQKLSFQQGGFLVLIFTGHECPSHVQMRTQMSKLIQKICDVS